MSRRGDQKFRVQVNLKLLAVLISALPRFLALHLRLPPFINLVR
jgi:hypothetical protein